jgi:hypothetical protein
MITAFSLAIQLSSHPAFYISGFHSRFKFVEGAVLVTVLVVDMPPILSSSYYPPFPYIYQ